MVKWVSYCDDYTVKPQCWWMELIVLVSHVFTLWLLVIDIILVDGTGHRLVLVLVPGAAPGLWHWSLIPDPAQSSWYCRVKPTCSRVFQAAGFTLCHFLIFWYLYFCFGGSQPMTSMFIHCCWVELTVLTKFHQSSGLGWLVHSQNYFTASFIKWRLNQFYGFILWYWL